MTGPFVEIAEAKSTSACAAAVDDQGVLTCEKFTAELFDWEIDTANPTTKAKLRTTGETVTVWHKFTSEAMTVGQHVTIARLPDGRWVTIVWPCE